MATDESMPDAFKELEPLLKTPCFNKTLSFTMNSISLSSKLN